MNASDFLAYAVALNTLQTDGAAKWAALEAMIKENRDPTPDEWAAAGTEADAAHIAVQAMQPAANG